MNDVIDFEITPRLKKSRRLVMFIFESLSLSIITLLLFAFGGVNIMKSIPQYQFSETQRVANRDELNSIGKESKLARFYRDGSAIDEYGMYLRYCYKHIHLMFDLYPDDFKTLGFESITDPYSEPTLNKDNDELFYFFTSYAVEEGVIYPDDPIKYYVEDVVDLEKHNNILVYNNELGLLTLNPKIPTDNGEANFGVTLYQELHDDSVSFSMNSMYKFYAEYYEEANDILMQTDKYQTAYKKYENYSLVTGRYIACTFLFTYLALAVPYFMIAPLFNKRGQTLSKMLFKVGTYNEDGTRLKPYKKIILGLMQACLFLCMLFLPFYIGYGLDFFSYPFGLIGTFLFTPLFLIVISGVLAFLNAVAMYLPLFMEENTTPVEYLINVRCADLREGD